MLVCLRARLAELASMWALAPVLEAEEVPLRLSVSVLLALVPRRLQIGSVVRWILMRSCIVGMSVVREACLVLGCSDEDDCYERMEDAVFLLNHAMEEAVLAREQGEAMIQTCELVMGMRGQRAAGGEDDDGKDDDEGEGENEGEEDGQGEGGEHEESKDEGADDGESIEKNDALP